MLEVGFGTGMVLFRIAPGCELYHGIDLSAAALARVKTEADRRGLSGVVLEQKAADTLAALEGGPFDTIVINSVAQYFPERGISPGRAGGGLRAAGPGWRDLCG